MAPVRVACRLSLTSLFYVWLFLCVLIPFYLTEPVVYDRQTLLDIRNYCLDAFDAELGNFDAELGNFADNTYGSTLRDIPDFLRRWPLDVNPRKRSGKLVSLKIHLRAGLPNISTSRPWTEDLIRFAVQYTPVPTSRFSHIFRLIPLLLPTSRFDYYRILSLVLLLDLVRRE